MNPSSATLRISKVQLVTLQEPIGPDLVAELDAADDRGIIVLVSVASPDGSSTAAAVAQVGRGWRARERTFDALSELAEMLHGEQLDPSDPAGIRSLATERSGRLSSGMSGEPSISELIEVALDGFVTALDRAATAAGSAAVQKPGTNPQDLLARLVPTANRYHLVPPPPPMTVDGRPSNTYPELEFLKPLGVNGTKGHLLERQGLVQGFDTFRFTKGSFVASRPGGSDLNFKWSRSPISSAVSISLCNHKEATRIQLRRNSIPTPRGRMFVRGDFDGAVEFARLIGYPVVSKPAAGVRGIGVVANIQDEAELRAAFDAYAESRLGGDDFIVEKHIDGGDYRIVVIDDQVVAAILRVPASVIGDGSHSVAELILQKNELRRQNPHLWGRLIKVDRAAMRRLSRQGVTLTTVPGNGEQVLLSDTSSLSQGGDSIDVMDEMHPTIKQAAVAATQAIPGLRYCGVDFLLADHRQPIDEQTSAGICELNAHAAIGNGEYPMFGSPRQVARLLFRRCAQQAGHDDRPALNQLNLRLEVRGKLRGTGYEDWFARHASDFGLTGWVEGSEKRVVQALVQGPALPASAMASLAVLGSRRSLPTTVRTTHADAEVLLSFEVRS
jgi:D-alanine-D-alanine ligase-like ATP-grasp enzyme/acylphosphatase